MGRILLGVMLVKAPRTTAAVAAGVVGLLGLGLAGLDQVAAVLGGMALTLLFVGVALAFLISIGSALVRLFQFVVLTTLRIAVGVKRVSRRRIDHAAF